MSDEITLVLPAQEDFHQIAHLVTGGLGARLELTYEQLEDLQLALEALLACREDDGDISIGIAVDDSRAVEATYERALATLDQPHSENPPIVTAASEQGAQATVWWSPLSRQNMAENKIELNRSRKIPFIGYA